MKLRMANTEKTLLRLVNIRPAKVAELVLAMWPQTKQPEKKARTVLAYLKALRRFGVRECNGVWFGPKPNGGGTRKCMAA